MDVTLYLIYEFQQNQEFRYINKHKQLNAQNFQLGKYNQTARKLENIRLIFQNRLQKSQISICTVTNTSKSDGLKRLTNKDISSWRKYIPTARPSNLTRTVNYNQLNCHSQLIQPYSPYMQLETSFYTQLQTYEKFQVTVLKQKTFYTTIFVLNDPTQVIGKDN